MLTVQTHRQVIRNLSTGRNNHSPRFFQLYNIHHTLERQFVEIKTIAGIVIRTHRLRIIINHHRTVSHLIDRIQSTDPTPVEFYATTDPIGSGTQYNDRPAVVFILNIVFRPIIGHIQVIGHCRIFSGQRIYLFNTR